MRNLCRLAFLALLIFAALASAPAVQAEPDAPGPSCIWAGGSELGVYSCSWGCDYTYEYRNGGWVLVGTNCGA